MSLEKYQQRQFHSHLQSTRLSTNKHPLKGYNQVIFLKAFFKVINDKRVSNKNPFVKLQWQIAEIYFRPSKTSMM